MTLLELTFQRCRASAECRRLLDTAITESRDLTATEKVTFDSLTARIAEFDSAIAARAALRTI